jgi:5'-phosphate synthase pdxT subunit
MSPSEVAELARHCLCGGYVIRVTSVKEALRAQSFGAVGVLCDLPPEHHNGETLRQILDAISVLPMCWPHDRELLQQVYYEKHGAEEPGGYFVLTLHRDTAKSKPWELAYSAVPLMRSVHSGEITQPIFVLCSDVEMACSAVSKGVDGIILNFFPPEAQLEAVFDASDCPVSAITTTPGERIIGVVALQGDYLLHMRALEEAIARRPSSVGVRVALIRTPEEFDAVDALVLSGGWSNLQTRLFRRLGLDVQIRALRDRGAPVLGVCAGMILSRTQDGAGVEDRLSLGLLDITVDNNVVHGMHNVTLDTGERRLVRFAKAPVVTKRSSATKVLAVLEDGVVVGVSEGRVSAFSFHDGIHDRFLDLCIECWR